MSQSGNESDSSTDLSEEYNGSDSSSETSSEESDSDRTEEDSDSESSTEDDDDELWDEFITGIDAMNKITQVVIAGEKVSDRTVFTYRSKVQVTVRNCTFQNSVEFHFYDAATLKFENCYFMNSKKVIFHENSSLNCQRVRCHRPALYEHFAKLDMNFEGCVFLSSKMCSQKTNSKTISEFQKNLNNLFKSFCDFIERLLSDDGLELKKLITFFQEIVFSFLLLLAVLVLVGLLSFISVKKI